MPLEYSPKDATTAWPEGDYQAALTGVEDTHAKSSGAPMQIWTWTVYHSDGRNQEIKEYVTVPGGTWKIKQLAKALGKQADFDAGTFQADDHYNAIVIVELKIEKQDGFDDKNRVQKYKAKGAQDNGSPSTPQRKLPPRPGSGPGPSTAPVSKEPQFAADDIPF